MKNIIFFIATIICFQAFGQRKPKIKGNRSVIDVHEELPPFKAITLKDDLDILLQRSATEGYDITADDNLIDVLKFKVEDSTLVISSFYKIIGKKKLEITVNYNYLESITLRDGKISMTDVLSSDYLDVNTYGTSRIELNATADWINLNMEEISSGDFNLASDSLNIVLKDRVDARIYAVGATNNITMHKNASAKMEGTTDLLSAKLFENSKLNAQMLEAKKVHLSAEQSPSAKINAIEDFELSAMGSSKAYLYGNPKITILHFLDTSQLHKEKQ